MNYPDDFETPAFPAGRPTAIARVMAIGAMVAFLLIVFVCGMLLWAARSGRVHPFLVSVNSYTGQWQLVGHDHGQKTLVATRALQEAAIVHFVQNWFSISANSAQNESLWLTCDRTKECDSRRDAPYGDKSCAIYCATGEDIFSRFIYDIVPDYQLRAANGEKWVVDADTIDISPFGSIGENGGTWRINVSVRSNVSAPINIVAFAKMARNIKSYPQYMGFYIADFNAYKIS